MSYFKCIVCNNLFSEHTGYLGTTFGLIAEDFDESFCTPCFDLILEPMYEVLSSYIPFPYFCLDRSYPYEE